MIGGQFIPIAASSLPGKDREARGSCKADEQVSPEQAHQPDMHPQLGPSPSDV